MTESSHPTDATIDDPDIRGSETALRRAAVKARELGERTKTPVYVLRDNCIVDVVTGATFAPRSPTQTQSVDQLIGAGAMLWSDNAEVEQFAEDVRRRRAEGDVV